MKHHSPLDPDFVPAILWNRGDAALVKNHAGSKPRGITLDRRDVSVSVYRTALLPNTAGKSDLNIRCVQ